MPVDDRGPRLRSQVDEFTARACASHSDLVESLTVMLEVAEVLNENTHELDEPPFKLSLIAKARKALEAALPKQGEQ